jgi:hypothetical protein
MNHGMAFHVLIVNYQMEIMVDQLIKNLDQFLVCKILFFIFFYHKSVSDLVNVQANRFDSSILLFF